MSYRLLIAEKQVRTVFIPLAKKLGLSRPDVMALLLPPAEWSNYADVHYRVLIIFAEEWPEGEK